MDGRKESPVKKKSKVLNYFFEFGIDEFRRPVDIQKAFEIGQTERRTLLRNCEFFHYFGVIESQKDVGKPQKKYESEGKNHTEYRLTTNKKVKFNIPQDELQRLNYATMITSMLVGTELQISDDYMLPIVSSNVFSMMTSFGGSTVRETFLASMVYDYFKKSDVEGETPKRSGLLGILIQLTNHSQPINIEVKVEDNVSKIDKTVIEGIIVNEDETFELKLRGGVTIKLNSLDDVKDIYIVSKKYPTTNSGIPSLNIQTLKDEIKSIPNYNEMREAFVGMIGELQEEYEDVIDTDFDTYIDNLIEDKVDGKTIIDRSNRKIRIDR